MSTRTLLIKDARIAVLSPYDVREHVNIVIEDGEVAYVGESIPQFAKSDEVIDASDSVVYPAPVNAHTHIAMVAFRGLASEAENPIYDIYWKVERAWTPERVYVASLYGAALAAAQGSPVVFDHYFFAEEVAKALERVGVRGYVGHTVMSWDGPWTGESELKRGIEFARSWLNRSKLIKPMLAPHAPDTVSEEFFLELLDHAVELKLPMHLHLAQTLREVKKVRERGYESPVQVLEKVGVLGRCRVLAAHCIFVDDRDLNTLAKYRGLVGVVHAPSTYMLGGYTANSMRFIERGIHVMVGTDAPSANDNIDIFEEVRLLLMMNRVVTKSATSPNYRDVVRMLYEAPKELVDPKLGSLHPGSYGDAIIVPKCRVEPYDNPLVALVYAVTPCDIKYCVVGGEIVAREGKPTKIDIDEVARKVYNIAEAMLREVGIRER